MELRKLNKDNISDVLDLELHSAPQAPRYSPYDKKALLFIFENPDNCGAVGMFEGDKLVGWGSYRTNWKKDTPEKDVSEISSIVVDKNYRRKGLGSRILNEIIDILVSKNQTKKFFLTASPLNTNALMLYLKKGFIIYDFRKDVYGPGSDRVYLSMKVEDSGK